MATSAIETDDPSDLGARATTRVADCDYAVWTQGAGMPLVLLHGWPVTSWRWRHVIPYFVANGFQTIAIDLRGLGASHTENGDFAKEKLAHEVLTVVGEVISAGERFSIVGHDWGASIAIAVAAISDQLASVVVEEEIPPGVKVVIPEPGAWRYPNWHSEFHRQRLFAETMIAAAQRDYFRFFLQLRADPYSLSRRDEEAFLQAYGDSTRLPVFLEYYRTAQQDGAFFDRLTQQPLDTPVLALGGNFAMGRAVGAATSKLFRHCDTCLFDNSGHYPAEEEPQLYGEAVVAFLSKHARQ